MTIIVAGLNRIRDLVATDIDRGELGTGTNGTTVDDTDLQTADAASIQTVTHVKTDKQITTSYLLPATSGTTGTYTEFKLYSNAQSVNFTRDRFTGVEWTLNGNNYITITKRTFFTNG